MRTELLLTNLGTPAEATPEAVRAFLAEFLSDPLVVDWPRWLWRPVLHGLVLRRRPARVAEQYRLIFGAEGSPLRAATERMALEVAARLGEDGGASAAYRYGSPRVDDALEEALSRAREAVVLPLFPQRTASTTGTVERLVRETVPRIGAEGRVRFALLPPDEPGYVAALADRARAALAEGAGAEHLVVSFHGIPTRVDRREGGRYSADCRSTYDALLARLGWDPARATLAYQSRFGPEPWLSPATAAVLAALPRRGVRRAAVTAPGFLTPGLETLEELGVRGAATFRAAGGHTLSLAAAPSDHPALLDALACTEPASHFTDSQRNGGNP